MKFISLKINNFLAIGEATISLDDRGLVLIQGDNKDNPSSDSNGAGKSSILNAVTYALYGVCANGVSGDKVVNRTAKKGCSVEIVIQDGDVKYFIARHRKSALFGNGTQVTMCDVGCNMIDLTKGTEKENQIVIDQIMGCSSDVFLASVYASQEGMVDLPALTDKNLKALIEEAAGVNILTAAHEEAKARARNAESVADAKRSAFDRAADAVDAMATQIRDLSAKDKEFNDGKPARIANLITIARDAVAEVKRINGDISQINIAAIKAEIDHVADKIDGLKSEVANETQLSTRVLETHSKASFVAREVNGAATSVAQIERNIATAEAKVGHDCGECGKTHVMKDIAKYVEAQTKALEVAQLYARDKATELTKAQGAVSDAQAALLIFQKSMSDVGSLVARSEALRASERQYDDLVSKRGQFTADAKAIAVKVDAVKVEVSPFAQMIIDYTANLEAKRADRDVKSAELINATIDYEIAQSAVKVFGPAGVRAHILDTVTPFLNARTAHYLSTLTDGDTTATWQTLTKSAKGDLKEKFTIDVTSSTGADSFAGLSGGEKRKVRLATAMALQDLVATRATKPIDAFFADEIDAALDDAGLQRLMDVLNEKARERGTVFIVSHTDLKDYVPNAITVTKKNGISTVEEEAI